ncbi:hypothetical protein ACSSS7_004866 [Eimeria intestinalis]
MPLEAAADSAFIQEAEEVDNGSPSGLSKSSQGKAVGLPPPAESLLPSSEASLSSEEETDDVEQRGSETTEEEEPETTEEEEPELPAAAPEAAAPEREEEKPLEPREAGAAAVGAKEVKRPKPWFFVATYESDLERGEDKDKEARELRRRWTLYKMHMAILADMEVMSLERVEKLSQSEDDGTTLQETKAKLQKICRARTVSASLWMALATEGGLRPDSKKSEAVLSLLRAQAAYYETVYSSLTGADEMSATKALKYREDPAFLFRRLASRLGAGDR